MKLLGSGRPRCKTGSLEPVVRRAEPGRSAAAGRDQDPASRRRWNMPPALALPPSARTGCRRAWTNGPSAPRSSAGSSSVICSRTRPGSPPRISTGCKSVDNPKLLLLLERAAGELGPPPSHPASGQCRRGPRQIRSRAAEAARLLESRSANPISSVDGLMTIAPLTDDRPWLRAPSPGCANCGIGWRPQRGVPLRDLSMA